MKLMVKRDLHKKRNEKQKQSSKVFCKKGILQNFAKLTGKHLRHGLNFIKKEILTQVFYCNS